jgi:hypothetical protein
LKAACISAGQANCHYIIASEAACPYLEIVTLSHGSSLNAFGTSAMTLRKIKDWHRKTAAHRKGGGLISIF